MREEFSFGIGCAWKGCGSAQAFLPSRNLAGKGRLYIKNHDWLMAERGPCSPTSLYTWSIAIDFKKKEPMFSEEKDDSTCSVWPHSS